MKKLLLLALVLTLGSFSMPLIAAEPTEQGDDDLGNISGPPRSKKMKGHQMSAESLIAKIKERKGKILEKVTYPSHRNISSDEFFQTLKERITDSLKKNLCEGVALALPIVID
ncbi:hypothetical protein HYY75_02960, partial [bacterium]|nr:hypothetical protein [bacterium]